VLGDVLAVSLGLGIGRHDRHRLDLGHRRDIEHRGRRLEGDARLGRPFPSAQPSASTVRFGHLFYSGVVLAHAFQRRFRTGAQGHPSSTFMSETDRYTLVVRHLRIDNHPESPSQDFFMDYRVFAA
jgi:hypothetical protein